jgi:hypothetical protein
MDIDTRLYVEIVPFDGPHSPHPHPVDDAHFNPDYLYKVLGMYNPSETSECYFVLANPQRQIWFIPQRHLRAYGLIDSDELFLSKRFVEQRDRQDRRPPESTPSVKQDHWELPPTRPARRRTRANSINTTSPDAPPLTHPGTDDVLPPRRYDDGPSGRWPE